MYLPASVHPRVATIGQKGDPLIAAMEAEVTQEDTASRCLTAAVFLPMDMETMQTFIAPGKQDLQERLEMC